MDQSISIREGGLHTPYGNRFFLACGCINVYQVHVGVSPIEAARTAAPSMKGPSFVSVIAKATTFRPPQRPSLSCCGARLLVPAMFFSSPVPPRPSPTARASSCATFSLADCFVVLILLFPFRGGRGRGSESTPDFQQEQS